MRASATEELLHTFLKIEPVNGITLIKYMGEPPSLPPVHNVDKATAPLKNAVS